MKFYVDTHGQLRIQDTLDIKADPGSPDLLILTREQTTDLADLILDAVANRDIQVNHCAVYDLRSPQRRQQ